MAILCKFCQILHMMIGKEKTFKEFAIEAFGRENTISFLDLKSVYEEWIGKTVSDSTFRVTLFRMKKGGSFIPVKRGWYEIEPKDKIMLPAGEFGGNIHSLLKSEFPFSNWVIWSSSFFNRFTSLQTRKDIIFLEMESGSEESAFHYLQNQDQKYLRNNLFLKPSEEIISNYVINASAPLIIKSLVSESPQEMNNNIPVPAVEKILVDLFVEELYLYPWINERDRIINEIFEITNINFSVLLRYASRRNRKEIIRDYITMHRLAKAELMEKL